MDERKRVRRARSEEEGQNVHRGTKESRRRQDAQDVGGEEEKVRELTESCAPLAGLGPARAIVTRARCHACALTVARSGHMMLEGLGFTEQVIYG